MSHKDVKEYIRAEKYIYRSSKKQVTKSYLIYEPSFVGGKKKAEGISIKMVIMVKNDLFSFLFTLLG